MPTLAELVQDGAARDAVGCGDAHGCDAGGSDEVRHRIDRDRDARAGRRDQDAADRGAGDVVAFSASRKVAFACCKSEAVTVCGTMPLLAGKKNAVEAPFSEARRASCQICA